LEEYGMEEEPIEFVGIQRVAVEAWVPGHQGLRGVRL
jgi:hypothetical protein